MKLSLLLSSSISTLFYIASASQFNEHPLGLLQKRDHGIPYASLPSATCATPSTCSSVTGSVVCRCSETMTTCVSTNGEYCWGSVSLTSTSCPSVPDTCTSTMTGSTTSCLCNDKNVLCVDNANNYCYGSVNAGAVSILPLPYASSAASASASPSTTVPVSSGSANPPMSVVNAPSFSATATPSSTTSGSSKLTSGSILTLGCAVLVAFIAI